MEFVVFSYWRALNVKNVWTVHFVEISRSISARNENIKFIASMYVRNICIKWNSVLTREKYFLEKYS